MAIEYDSKQFESGTLVDSTKEDVGVKKITLKDVPVTGTVEVSDHDVIDNDMTWRIAPSTEELQKLTVDKNFDFVGIIIDYSEANKPRIVEVPTATGKDYFATFTMNVQATVKLSEQNYVAQVTENVRIQLLMTGLTSPVFNEDSIKPTISGTPTAIIDVGASYALKYSCVISAMSIMADGMADVTVALVTPKTI